MKQEVLQKISEMIPLLEDIENNTQNYTDGQLNGISKEIFKIFWSGSGFPVHNKTVSFEKYSRLYKEDYIEFRYELPLEAVNTYYSMIHGWEAYGDIEQMSELLNKGIILRLYKYYLNYFRYNVI